jgi:hypothetical protein
MIRILIADDHDVVRFGLRTIMEEQARLGWPQRSGGQLCGKPLVCRY